MNERINDGGTSELNPVQETSDERAPSPEQRRPSPRIYVASLADYNAGELVGAWIDANQEPEALHTEIEATLAESHEEWPRSGPSTTTRVSARSGSTSTKPWTSSARWPRAIAEHGTAFAAYVSWAGTDDEALRAFADCYLGQWPSLEAYARTRGY